VYGENTLRGRVLSVPVCTRDPQSESCHKASGQNPTREMDIHPFSFFFKPNLISLDALMHDCRLFAHDSRSLQKWAGVQHHFATTPQ